MYHPEMDAFQQLLEVEQQLAARLEKCRTEAAAVVAQARADAADHVALVEAEVASELTALEARAAATRAHDVAAIEAAGTAAAVALSRLGEREVRELAALVVQRVMDS